jgi:hypothetical protein
MLTVYQSDASFTSAFKRMEQLKMCLGNLLLELNTLLLVPALNPINCVGQTAAPGQASPHAT